MIKFLLKKDKISKKFDFFSGIFDDFMNFMHSFEIRKMIKEIEFNKNDCVLDLCCGSGYLCRKISHKINKVTGIDFSEKMIKKAKKKSKDYRNVYFYNQDVNKLSLNEKFDRIFLVEAVYYFSDLKKLFKQVFKHLKNKGEVYILTSYYKEMFLEEFYVWFSKKIYRLPVWVYSKEDFEVIGEKIGFSKINVRERGFFQKYLMINLKK